MPKRKRKIVSRYKKIYFKIIFILIVLSYCYTHVYRINISSSKIKIIGAVFFIVPVLLLIKFIYKSILKKKQDLRYINSNIETVDKMTGEEFEEFLKAHFEKLGYKAKLTAKTGDYGADIVLDKSGSRIVVQAKRWINKVGIEAVQQIIGAKAYYKADKCIVITNNYFTPNAVNLAASNNSVELLDRKKLINIMSKNNLQINNEGAIRKRIICSKCGAEMVLKQGQYGGFYGCSNYPKCKNTKSMN